MSSRWNDRTQKRSPSAPEVDRFLDEIEEVCRKHGMSLGHQDSQGSFRVCDMSEENIEWLRDAADSRRPET